MPPKKKSTPSTSTSQEIKDTKSTNAQKDKTVQPQVIVESISNIQTNLVASSATIVSGQPKPSSVESDDDKKNKRRGRKPKDKFNIDDTFAEQNNSLLDFDNNIIIKLPIACKDLESELSLTTGSVLYNPILSEPQPFNECSETNYGIIEQPQDGLTTNTPNQSQAVFAQINDSRNSNINFTNNTIGQPGQQSQPPANYMDYYQNKINDLLSDLDDSASKKRLTQIEILLNKKYKTAKQIDLLHNLAISYEGTKWPQTSNICCFWCCHSFDNTPWGIPKKYNADTGIFTMYGIFCTPNCVLAHLLRHESNNISLWEQVSLLNLLHYKIYETDENIIPAPDNVCLRMFGGPLNIQEFRALTIKNDKKYNVNFPPCVIITPVLEETKKVFNQDSYCIPIDKKRINKIQTELKIKRTNNVYKNSLENVMNISYNNQ
jgi:hypothetical protein